MLREHSAEYLYLSCVAFVRQVKKGPLAETSPMINDISGVSTWSKINQGMFKMYQVGPSMLVQARDGWVVHVGPAQCTPGRSSRVQRKSGPVLCNAAADHNPIVGSQAELMAKFPIMQHFLFGTLLPFPEVPPELLAAASGSNPGGSSGAPPQQLQRPEDSASSFE